MRSILAIDWIFQFCGYYLIPYIIHTHISRANIIIQINIYSHVLYSSHIIYLLGLYLLCISPSIYVELFPRGPGEKSSLRTRANLFSPLSKSKGEKGRRRNDEIASKVNPQQSRDRSRKLLSRAGKPSWKARSLFKAHREDVIGEKCRAGNENRVVSPSLSSRRRRAWSSEISDFSRARARARARRGWQIEFPRTFARSEEDGKARKSRRAALARGYRKVRRDIEKAKRGGWERTGGLEGSGDVRA